MANSRALLYRTRIIRRKVDLNAVGEVLRPHRIWSSLPNLARATLLNTASEAAGEVAVAREKGAARNNIQCNNNNKKKKLV